MRTIGYLIQKEFIQIFRNRTLLPIMFIAPIVQMLVLVFAANMNMKDIDFCVYDEDGSLTSTRLISKFEGSPFFNTPGHPVSPVVANEMLRTGKVDILINIPSGFERELSTRGSADIQLLVDGINSGSAVLISAYAQNILREFNSDIKGVTGILDVGKIAKKIDISYNHWYNPELDFKIFMVPGILVILVTMVGWILAAFNIVREKEIGTIEQINVTPIKKYQFIIGKLVPFWLIAMFELALGLFIGKIIFDIPFLGSIFLLFSFAGLYLVVALSIVIEKSPLIVLVAIMYSILKQLF